MQKVKIIVRVGKKYRLQNFYKILKECYIIMHNLCLLPHAQAMILFLINSKLGYKNIINSGSSDDLYSNYPGLYNLSDLYLNKKKMSLEKS